MADTAMRPRLIVLTVAGLALVGAASPSLAHASERVTTTVAATTQLDARTALTVSTEILRFDVTDPEAAAVATVDFVARARTRRDGEVMLTVETLRALNGPGGAADINAVIEFGGDGDGTLTGSIRSAAPVLAGRWTGSGRRTGRLRFSLSTRNLGAYTLPVRFVLSAP